MFKRDPGASTASKQNELLGSLQAEKSDFTGRPTAVNAGPGSGTVFSGGCAGPWAHLFALRGAVVARRLHCPADACRGRLGNRRVQRTAGDCPTATLPRADTSRALSLRSRKPDQGPGHLEFPDCSRKEWAHLGCQWHVSS